MTPPLSLLRQTMSECLLPMQSMLSNICFCQSKSWMPITCSMNWEGDIVRARASSSAEKVLMLANYCFSATIINLLHQFSAYVTMTTMENSYLLILVLLFPHQFHWSAALTTQQAADCCFCALTHSSIHFVSANFVVFAGGYYCPFLFLHINASLSFLFCSQGTAQSQLFGHAHIRNTRTCGHFWKQHWCTTPHTVHYLYSYPFSFYYLLNARPCLPRAGDRRTHKTWYQSPSYRTIS